MGTFLFKLFIKDYENTKNPTVREKYGKLAGIVGIVSNLLLCIMKVVIGSIVNSIAIIADGINNLADASSSIITLVGFKLAAMPEDEEHPYGHARIEYLTGLIVSVIIMVLGLQLLKTSIDKVFSPEPMQFSYITIIVLIIAIAVKVWQSLFNISAGNRINSVALIATGTDSRNDVIATSAVLVSLIIGHFANIQLDGIMGCVVALFIMWSGFQLIKETSSPLLGEAPDPELVNGILRYSESHEGVLGTHDLIVHNYGPGRTFASIHIEIDAAEDIMKSHDLIDNIEKELNKMFNIHLTVHMDPVKLDDPILNHLKIIIDNTLNDIDGVFGWHDLRIVPGPTHTNVIFDTVISPECQIKQSEIKSIVQNAIQQIDKNYFASITFDTSYTKPNK